MTAIDLHAPDRVVELAAGETGELSRALGPGYWFLIPRTGETPLRPPRPLIIPQTEASDEAAPTVSVSEATVAAGAQPTRALRVAAYAAALAGSPPEKDIEALERTLDAFAACGLSTTALDQVLALERCPEVAVRLLFRAGPDRLAERLTLEHHGAAKWIFVAPEAWGRAMRIETHALEDQLRCTPCSRSARAKSVGAKPPPGCANCCCCGPSWRPM